MNQKILNRIEFLIKTLEIVICIIILIAVAGGIINLVKYVIDMFFTSSIDVSYDKFNEFLKHALVLIVGIELLEMIITKSHEAILTLILFVIARKMLVYSSGMLDILIASVSVALMFVIIKFVTKDEKVIAKIDNTFSASMPLNKIKREYHLDVPTEMANTIGGLIYELANIEDIEEIKDHSTFIYGKHLYKVIGMKNGVIERVRIEKNN